MSEAIIKKIVVVISLLYAVSFLERLAYNYTKAITNEAYKEEKTKYQNTIQNLETKLYQHEINLIKRNSGIDTLTNGQLDSAWSNIFN